MSFKIAFDLDETLDQGFALAAAFNVLNEHSGVDCLILSARAAHEPTFDEKFDKVTSLGIRIIPSQLHVVPGETVNERAEAKAKFCRDNEVDILIDDNRVYCSWVKAMSPKTTVLHKV